MTLKRTELEPTAPEKEETSSSPDPVQLQIEAAWARASAIAAQQQATALAAAKAEVEAEALKLKLSQAQREMELAWHRASTAAQGQRTEAARAAADQEAQRQAAQTLAAQVEAAQARQLQVQREMEAAWAAAVAQRTQARPSPTPVAPPAKAQLEIEAAWERATAERAEARARAQNQAQAELSKQQAQARVQAEVDAAWVRASAIAVAQRAQAEQARQAAATQAQHARQAAAVHAESEARKKAFQARFHQEAEQRAQADVAYQQLLSSAGIRQNSKRQLLAHSPWAGRFEVVGLLATGPQGATFAVIDRRSGASCVAKVFDLQGARNWDDLGLAEREAETLQRIRHPLLPEYVTVLVDDDSGDRIIITKKIEGISLATAAERLPIAARTAAALPLLRNILEALQALHNAVPPLVHRDVKPENIIVSNYTNIERSKFHLIDLSRVGLLNHAGAEAVDVGTFEFIAPEQISGSYSAASDLFSLAMTTVAFVSNEEPGLLPTTGSTVDVDACIPTLGTGLRRFLAGLLHPDPAQRPASAAAALRQLAVLH